MKSGIVSAFLALYVSTGFTEPSQISRQVTLASDLPSGEYYYEEPSSWMGEHYLFFRKSGFTVIGLEHHAHHQLCFRGFLIENRITNITRIFPPYSPASRMEVSKEGIDLNRYQTSQRAVSRKDRETLLDCIHFFWR